jgi:inosine-uridine nucleoside N-ribohydrolase
LPQKVLIDADPGIGDAVAISLAILDPDIDVVGITATRGCISGDQSTRNIQAIVETLDPPKWPRLGGASGPAAVGGVDYGVVGVGPSEVNGATGLGDREFRVAELHHPRDSVKLMTEMVRVYPNEITLLTLGPLTNVEIACERAPDFLGMLKGLICLGGTVERGGDVTAVAEFNMCANPEAARAVLRSPATKTLVPLDVSNSVVLTFEQFDRLVTPPSSAVCRFFEELLPFAFRAHHQHLGLEGIPLREVVALASIAQPRIFQGSAMAIDVETTGELTRGMTVFDRRRTQQWQTNIDVLTEVDAQAVLDYFSRIVRLASA